MDANWWWGLGDVDGISDPTSLVSTADEGIGTRLGKGKHAKYLTEWFKEREGNYSAPHEVAPAMASDPAIDQYKGDEHGLEPKWGRLAAKYSDPKYLAFHNMPKSARR